MKWRNISLVFMREVRDQLRDKRTLFMIAVLPMLLYPALGIGMVQMTVLFSEQPRTVVMLGEEFLPDEPKLMDENGFQSYWFSMGERDSEKLEVVSNIRELPVGEGEEYQKQLAEREEMLQTTAAIRDRLLEINRLESQASSEENGANNNANTETVERLRAEVSELLGASMIQVAVIIPDGFADSLAKMDELLQQRDNDLLADFDYPRPMIIRNSADEKSLIAFERVKDAFRHWEDEILSDRLTTAGLPSTLHTPVKIDQVDVAVGEQLAANVWSKVFPAMLIIMSVTGAFYPAIDLGAGEKERGTMETLLICPATRAEIVMGKFFTVMLFSVSTALLNLGSMGMTGQYMVSLIGGAGGSSKLAGMTFPPLASLTWLVVLLLPLAALFSAICLALALFARSSKEGQHYLTPLLMVTMGLTVFCLSPAVEITPFYSIMPIVNVALLLKGLLLAPLNATPLYVYVIPVLVSSIGYSLLALWWAIEMFANERVLFREAERFEPGLWLKHLMREKGNTPSFAQGGFCFMMIMFLQFGAMKFMRPDMSGDAATSMMKMLMIQQLAIVAAPALVMAFVLTRKPLQTLRIRLPHWKVLGAAVMLPLVLHPLTVELQAYLNQVFFPPLPESIGRIMAMMGNDNLPLWKVLAVFALAPAICEEVAFRGFILSGFERTRQKRVAIALSALAFGIMHMIPQQVFNASLLGLVLGLIAVRSRSLLPCVVFHFIYNSLAVLHSKFGSDVPTENIFGYLFQFKDGALRYQTLLLLMCAIVVLALMRGLIAFRPDAEEAEETQPESVTPLKSTTLTAF